jgi:hypothetical protein
VEKRTREELERRFHAVIADALDREDGRHPDGFDIGPIGIVYECLFEGPPTSYLKRADAGYTPDDDVISAFSWFCTDDRPWVQGGTVQLGCLRGRGRR